MVDPHSEPLRYWKACFLLFLASVWTPVRGGEDALFPYGPAHGDSDFGNIGSRHVKVTLPIPMHYYGQVFENAYISKDGLLGLEEGVQFVEVKWREGTPNPAVDLPFIAPFHYDGFIAINDPDNYPGKIYYKLLQRTTDSALSENERAFMNQLDDYLNDVSVVLKRDFRSLFVLKVTWENVTSRSDCNEMKLKTTEGCPMNTFQLLLAGNEKNTFAIFNYYKMESTFTEHQLAGVNGGYGLGWTDVTPCTGQCAKRSKGDSSRFRQLVSRVGSDVEGRYILVVDNSTIFRGGCQPEGLKSVELEVYPRQAGMFGGEMLSVSAICLEPGTKIYCRFGFNDQTRSEGVMETRMRGRCPVPILTTRGQVALELSTDNMSWKYRTLITIALPSRLPLMVDRSDMSSWYDINPEELKVRWWNNVFSSNRAATVNINLIGYREDRHSNENKLIMNHLEQLATDVLVSHGQHTIDPSRFSCKNNCGDFEIALLQIQVEDQYVDEFTTYQMVSHHTGKPFVPDHIGLVLYRRVMPDGCLKAYTQSLSISEVLKCMSDGSGNQCCYKRDGSLMYAADSYQGSTPDRSHDWGAAPYNVPDHVPSLSHWLHDVITFYYCCLWTEYKQCNYYMDRRATRDCVSYVPPHSATVYWDTRITTFDGKSYPFGGSGDFWILQSDILNIQGRFEEKKNEVLQIDSQNQLAPTSLTSIVMWISGSDVVTVTKVPSGRRSAETLDIFVGTQRHLFNAEGQMWQDFKSVSIMNNNLITTNPVYMTPKNFTVMFEGGAAVQVTEWQGLMHLVINLPPSSGQTKGLLGTLDGNARNDFTNAQGEIIPADAQQDKVYLDFSRTWNVSSTNGESKFHWPKSASSKSPLFDNPPDFPYKPNMESMKPSEQTVKQTCGESQSCQWNYYATGNATIARASGDVERHFQQLQNAQAQVRSCGLLDIPMAVKSPTVYTEGSRVTVTACRPDNAAVAKPDAQLVYTCRNSSSASSSAHPVWSPQPDRDLCPHTGEEASPQSASDVGMIVGIVIGAVAFIIAIILVVVIVHRHRKSGEETVAQPVPPKRTTVPTDVVIEPGTDETLLKKGAADRERGPVRMSEVRARSEESV